MSVYDWLTGMPSRHFDVSPLVELGLLENAELREAVSSFIGAGMALMIAGQVFLENAPVAYAGLAILAVGIVFGVQSQRGK